MKKFLRYTSLCVTSVALTFSCNEVGNNNANISTKDNEDLATIASNSPGLPFDFKNSDYGEFSTFAEKCLVKDHWARIRQDVVESWQNADRLMRFPHQNVEPNSVTDPILQAKLKKADSIVSSVIPACGDIKNFKVEVRIGNAYKTAEELGEDEAKKSRENGITLQLEGRWVPVRLAFNMVSNVTGSGYTVMVPQAKYPRELLTEDIQPRVINGKSPVQNELYFWEFKITGGLKGRLSDAVYKVIGLNIPGASAIPRPVQDSLLDFFSVIDFNLSVEAGIMIKGVSGTKRKYRLDKDKKEIEFWGPKLRYLKSAVGPEKKNESLFSDLDLLMTTQFYVQNCAQDKIDKIDRRVITELDPSNPEILKLYCGMYKIVKESKSTQELLEEYGKAFYPAEKCVEKGWKHGNKLYDYYVKVPQDFSEGHGYFTKETKMDVFSKSDSGENKKQTWGRIVDEDVKDGSCGTLNKDEVCIKVDVGYRFGYGSISGQTAKKRCESINSGEKIMSLGLKPQ